MSLNWVSSDHIHHMGFPPNAVQAGYDIDGDAIFVGRSFHRGDLIPAKVIPCRNVVYVPYGGRECETHCYELLCGSGFTWVFACDGQVPQSAVCAGHQSNGEPLYVGRAAIGGSLTTGKVHPRHRCIYVPFGGYEHRLHNYEVLTHPLASH